MSPLLVVVAASWLAGFLAFVGGFLAWLEGTAETESKREFIHGVVAFGGGILLAAVAFALAPVGIATLSPVVLITTFSVGGVAFCILDVWMSKKGGPKAQFLAMLMDYVPEAISLGAVFVHDHRLGLLLAAFIGAQNLPEGFNSFREISASGMKPRRALATLLAVSLLGPAAAGLGYLVLQDRAGLTAGIMSFAAGGIMYLIFQHIAPESRMRRHWTPALGAVLGFMVGMIGKQLIV
ncbi:divalent cation transporter [Candidatus Bipolaricaulota bacterium]|nr:divalent cation transporter [Candidatus Bipolaricaulota bacterium]